MKTDKSSTGKKQVAKTLIEVISSSLTEEEKVMENDIFKRREAEEGEQIRIKGSSVRVGNYSYGFNQSFNGFFDDLEVRKKNKKLIFLKKSCFGALGVKE